MATTATVTRIARSGTFLASAAIQRRARRVSGGGRSSGTRQAWQLRRSVLACHRILCVATDSAVAPACRDRQADVSPGPVRALVMAADRRGNVRQPGVNYAEES